MSSLADLPCEIRVYLFEHIYDRQDFCNLACTCQSFAAAAPLARNFRHRGREHAFDDAKRAISFDKMGSLQWLLTTYTFDDDEAMNLGAAATQRVRSRAMELLNQYFKWKEIRKNPAILSYHVRKGHLSVLRWWHRLKPIRKWSAKHLFSDAVAHGHVRTAQWIRKKSHLTREECHRVAFIQFFIVATHLPMLQWLYETDILVRKNENYRCRNIFACAGAHGHLETVKWMRNVSLVTDADIRESVFDIMRGEAGFSSVIQWLYDERFVPAKDNFRNLQAIIVTAAEHGHLSMLQWLHETFRLTANDLGRYNGSALAAAAHNHELAVVRWMMETFYSEKKTL